MADFNVILDGKRVGGPAYLVHSRSGEALPHETSRKMQAHYSGGEDYCRRAAVADAWAIAKRIKQIKAHKRAPKGDALLERAEKEIKFALDQDNSEPSELYGAALGGEDRDLKKVAGKLRESIDRQVATTSYGKKLTAHDPDAVEGLMKNIANNLAYTVDEICDESTTLGAIDPSVQALYDRKPDLAEIRKRKPRPLHKLYGPNPTPEQIAASKAEHAKWNSEYRKASKLHKAAVEQMNEALHQEKLYKRKLGRSREAPERIGAQSPKFHVTEDKRGMFRRSRGLL
jgi:hypothetical protein